VTRDTIHPAGGILVPLDGSALAEEALEVGAILAHRAQAELHLVTVQVAPLPTQDRGDAGRGAAARQLRHDILEYLEAQGEALAIRHGVLYTCAVLHGPPAQSLAEYVKANPIRLVVMTSHGRGGASPRWLGSIADRLLRRVTAPVLVLRAGTALKPQRFSRLLIALDGTAASSQLMRRAVALGSLFPDAEYTLVEVVEPPRPALHGGPVSAEELTLREQAAAADLDRRAARLRKSGMVVTAKVVVAERVAEQLIGLAYVLGADLIAVGTQRPRSPARQALGSVADKVVRGADLPVLVVPLRGRASQPIHRVARHAIRHTVGTVG
jgi:nucleotide-binding universal stress UspA family protein